MTSRPVFDEPSKTVAVDGEVVVQGPDGVGHAFTPGAARETSRRLAETAEEAERQHEDGDKAADEVDDEP